jgi:hypothetical protein
MNIVPLQPIASQTLQVQLNGQACTVDVFQYPFGLFLTLTVGTTLIIASQICQNLNRLVREAYLGFSGDFVFIDTQGTSDPVYTGLGSRWQLVYLAPADLALLGLSS